ncbi:hypothetical protein ACFQMH_41645 [Streptomyces viridiviolaceus]|uniref:Uncharacterized protein n=1 Tax=Streptomyces viridiviolaceus TaxID=68282 RepID=A0ABW2EFH8_9ACTN|nr:hypothetical protein [Streptomyces viridiviolaceus]
MTSQWARYQAAGKRSPVAKGVPLDGMPGGAMPKVLEKVDRAPVNRASVKGIAAPRNCAPLKETLPVNCAPTRLTVLLAHFVNEKSPPSSGRSVGS